MFQLMAKIESVSELDRRLARMERLMERLMGICPVGGLADGECTERGPVVCPVGGKKESIVCREWPSRGSG